MICFIAEFIKVILQIFFSYMMVNTVNYSFCVAT
jgi:hypothetical protein